MVADDVTLFDPIKRKHYDVDGRSALRRRARGATAVTPTVAAVKARFGVSPSQLADMQVGAFGAWRVTHAVGRRARDTGARRRRGR